MKEVEHKMKWLVQEFLNNSSNVDRMVKALEKLSIEYLLIKINKDNTLSIIDKKTKIPFDNSKELIRSFIKDEKVMIYGSKKFSVIADEMNIKPGSFLNENFEYEIIHKKIGSYLLNNEFVVGELSELNPKYENFFIRPTGNTKLFTGMEISKKDFLDWRNRESKEDSEYIGQKLMISPIKNIKSEYRFFVVEQKIITGSSYKINGEYNIKIKPSKKIYDYAQKMIDIFPISKAFVIDIAETDSEIKVIEYNNINTSGLYGCDEYKIIKAINKLK